MLTKTGDNIGYPGILFEKLICCYLRNATQKWGITIGYPVMLLKNAFVRMANKNKHTKLLLLWGRGGGEHLQYGSYLNRGSNFPIPSGNAPKYDVRKVYLIIYSSAFS